MNDPAKQAHWVSMLPLIQAFIAGEEIEYASTMPGPFSFTATPSFGQGAHYRLKPKPQWRPYRIEDGDKIPKYALAVRKGGFMPRAFVLDGKVLRFCEATCVGFTSFDDLFQQYDRIDERGNTSPFGILE